MAVVITAPHLKLPSASACAVHGTIRHTALPRRELISCPFPSGICLST